MRSSAVLVLLSAVLASCSVSTTTQESEIAAAQETRDARIDPDAFENALSNTAYKSGLAAEVSAYDRTQTFYATAPSASVVDSDEFRLYENGKISVAMQYIRTQTVLVEGSMTTAALPLETTSASAHANATVSFISTISASVPVNTNTSGAMSAKAVSGVLAGVLAGLFAAVMTL